MVSHHGEMTAEEKARQAKYESTLYREVDCQGLQHGNHRREASLWIATLMSAVICSLVVGVLHVAVGHLSNFRGDLVVQQLNISPAAGVAVAVAMTCAFVIGSLLCTQMKGTISGSGLPGVIAYLNGVDLEAMFGFQSFARLFSGTILSTSAGLAIGYEGPAVRMGATIARFVTGLFPKLSGDHKLIREQVAIGAGMGLSAAFQAPIAGTVFVFEELNNTSLSPDILARTFLGCLIVDVLMFLSVAAPERSRKEFEQSYSYPPSCLGAVVLPFCIIVGVCGGLLGAAFNWLNIQIERVRQGRDKPWRVGEALIIACVTALLFSGIALIGGCESNNTTKALLDDSIYSSLEKGYRDGTLSMETCIPLHIRDQFSVINHGDGMRPMDIEGLERVGCSKLEPSKYNAISSLTLTSLVDALKMMLYKKVAHIFSAGELFAVLVVYFLLACTSAGALWPSGVLLPQMYIGACMGRFIGVLVDIDSVDPGLLAMIGSAAMLAGSSRLVLTLAIVMVEITGALQTAPFIAVSAVTSMLTAQYFNDGLYHALNHLRCVPFLHEPKAEHQSVRCRDLMASPVVSLAPKIKIREAYERVRTTTHNVFPVVETDGRLVGSVHRSDIQESIIQVNKEGSALEFAIDDAAQDTVFARGTGAVSSNPYTQGIAAAHYVEDIMDKSPFSVIENQLGIVALNSYQSLGLRQVAVVCRNGCLKGVLTRKDLLPEKFESRYRSSATEILSPTPIPVSNGITRNPLSPLTPLAEPNSETADQFTSPSSLNPLFEGSRSIDSAESLGLPEISHQNTRAAACILRCAYLNLQSPSLSPASLDLFSYFLRFQWTLNMAPIALILLSLFEPPFSLVDGKPLYVCSLIVETICIASLLIMGKLDERTASAANHSSSHIYWLSLRKLGCIATLIDILFIFVLLIGNVDWIEAYAICRPTRFFRSLFLIESNRGTRQLITSFRRIGISVVYMFLLATGFVAMYSLGIYVCLHALQHKLNTDSFSTLGDAFRSMTVLLTTANFPDIMMPYYNLHPLYVFPFLIFLLIANLILLNVFLAVIIDGLLKSTRKWVRKLERYRVQQNLRAFEMLSGADGQVAANSYISAVTFFFPYDFVELERARVIYSVVDTCGAGRVGLEDFLLLCDLQYMDIKKNSSHGSHSGGLQGVIRRVCLSKFFEPCVMALIILDIALIVAQDDQDKYNPFTITMSSIFVLEIGVRFIGFGPSALFGDNLRIADTVIVFLQFVLEIIGENGGLSQGVNMLRILRFGRLLMINPDLSKLVKTIGKSVNAVGRNLLLIVASMWLFAVLGMALYNNVVKIYPSHGDVALYCASAAPNSAQEYACRDYESMKQLMDRPCYQSDHSTISCEMLNPSLVGTRYAAYNFYHNNFNSAFNAAVTLFELLFVNNWHIIMDGFMRLTYPVSFFFFLLFYAIAVVVSLSSFIAYIIEKFVSASDDNSATNFLYDKMKNALEAVDRGWYFNQEYRRNFVVFEDIRHDEFNGIRETILKEYRESRGGRDPNEESNGMVQRRESGALQL